MKKLSTNNWELFQVKGWEHANLTLTQLFNREIERLKMTNNSTHSERIEAAKTVWNNMHNHFEIPLLQSFDALNPETCDSLTNCIQKILGVHITWHLINTNQI